MIVEVSFSVQMFLLVDTDERTVLRSEVWTPNVASMSQVHDLSVDDDDGWGAVDGRKADLNPRFVAALMGVPLGLADALHLGGNGLVPIVAAHAFAVLADRLGIGRIEQR